MNGPRLNLTLVVHVSLPAGASDEQAERAWRQCYQPLIGAIHHTPGVKLALVLGGEMVEDLQQRHPEGLQWIRNLVQREQVELVGTTLHDAMLTSIPERDAVGQLRAHARLLRKVFGVRPTGAWIPHGVWDPLVPRLLVDADLSWTLLDERGFGPPVRGEAPQRSGVWHTERDGKRIALLPVDGRAFDMIPRSAVKPVLAHLSRRARSGDDHVVVALEGTSFGLRPGGDPRRDQSWFATFLAALGRAGRSVQTLLPSETLTMAPRRGRVYLRAFAPRSVGLPWERNLMRYDEANRLHKRMLRVSTMVDKLARQVKDDAHSDIRPDPSQLEQARRYLYRAQAAPVYGHGDVAGVYDPADRSRTWRDLLRAERVVLSALKVHQRLLVEQCDLDADGHDEIALRTPTASLVIEPDVGGAVGELSVLQAARNLVDTITRRRERYHVELEDAPEEPTVNENPTSDDADPLGDTTMRIVQPPADLRDELVRDDSLRLSFRERLLGPEATVSGLASGTVTELAPGLADGPWQVVDAARRGDDAVEAVLARDARVTNPAGEQPIRLHKKYRLRREPVLEYKVEVINRSHGAVRARIATEITLALGNAPGARPLVVDGRRLGVDVAREVGEFSTIRVEGPDVVVDLAVSPAAQLWLYPVRTVHRHQGAWVLGEQGTALVFVWPVELWENEKSRYKITLTVKE